MEEKVVFNSVEEMLTWIQRTEAKWVNDVWIPEDQKPFDDPRIGWHNIRYVAAHFKSGDTSSIGEYCSADDCDFEREHMYYFHTPHHYL